jgi:hypothetical protein
VGSREDDEPEDAYQEGDDKTVSALLVGVGRPGESSEQVEDVKHDEDDFEYQMEAERRVHDFGLSHVNRLASPKNWPSWDRTIDPHIMSVPLCH